MDARKKILLVDDDPEIRIMIAAFLSSEVYEVTEADSASAAIQQLSIGTSFDLAIIDFWLGDDHAVSVMDMITSSGHHIPVIMISGGNRSMDLEATEAVADISGAIVFLQKPFHRVTLLAAVNSAMKT